MKITIKELEQYAYCPKLHNLKQKIQLAPSLEEYYDDTLHRLMYRLLFMAQDGEITVRELKIIWSSSSIVQKKIHKFAYYNPVNWKSNISEFNRKGTVVLNYLINTYVNSLGSIIAVNEPYSIKLSKDIEICGEWELIQEDPKTKQIEVFIFKEHEKIAHIPIGYDFKSVLDAIAFRKTFNKKEDGIVIQSFSTDKRQVGNIKNIHIKSTIDSVLNICKAIESNIVYRYPSYKCRSCAMKLVCEKGE